jgi:ribonuclease HII
MIFESKFLTSFPCWLVATDEAGRGPLAGPVVAGAVALRVESQAHLKQIITELRAAGVDDSKKLTATRREALAQISWKNLQVTWTQLDAGEIDRINILAASLQAMKLAAEEVVSSHKKLPVVWLIDGNRKPKDANPAWKVHPIVKGDSHSALIGLASVMAKVQRDNIMQKLHQQYPEYGFDQHAGYPTEKHRQAIITHGPTPIHRQTFRGVREHLPR